MTRKILPILLIALLAGCASTSDEGAKKKDEKKDPNAVPTREAGYSTEPGPFAVGVIPEGVLHDAQRNKDLPFSVEYPIRGTNHPVIIFSHALGLSKSQYLGLSSYWASFGYVVIKPSHADAGSAARLRDSATPPEAQTPQQWRDRARDISFIIDSFAQLEQQYPELAGKLDRSRVGVGGHSYGAFTTMLLAGATPFMNNAPIRLADPRIKAFLAMSPQGVDATTGLTAESWRDVRSPVLFMTGSADVSTRQADPANWRRQAFENSPAGDKYFVSVEGAGTTSFTGQYTEPRPTDPRGMTNTNPPLSDPNDPYGRQRAQIPQDPRRDRSSAAFERERFTFGTIRLVSLAFWDAYLQNRNEGREYLQKLSTRSDLTFATK